MSQTESLTFIQATRAHTNTEKSYTLNIPGNNLTSSLRNTAKTYWNIK